MSKRRLTYFCVAVGALVMIGAVALFSPHIVRWSLPHIIHSLTGYEATISSLEFSIREPSLTLRGIRLNAGEDNGTPGAVDAVRLIGAWTNPLRGSLFTPVSLDIRGVDVELPERKGGKGTFEPDTALAFLFRFQRLSVDGPRILIHFPGGSTELTALALNVSAPEEGSAPGSRVISGNVNLTASGYPGSAPWKAGGEASLRGTISPSGKAEGAIRCVANDVSAPGIAFSSLSCDLPFSFSNGTVKLEKSRVDVSGLVLASFSDGGPPFSANMEILAAEVALAHPFGMSLQASVKVGNLFSADIRANGPLTGTLAAAAEVRVDDAAKLLAYPAAAGMLPVPPDRTIRAKGPFILKARFAVPLAPPATPKDWQAEITFRGMNAAISGRGFAASCTLSDHVAADMRQGNVSFNGSLVLSDLSLDSPSFRAAKGQGRVVFNGSPESISVREAEIIMPGLTLVRDRPLSFQNVRLTGRGTWDRVTGNAREVSGQLSLDQLGPFQLSLASMAPIDATVRAERIGIQTVLPLLGTLYPPLQNWTAEGTADLNLRFRENESLAGTLALNLASFSDSQGSYVAENCAAGISLKGKMRSFTPESLAAEMRLDKGEALLKGLYINLSATPVLFSVSAAPAGDGFSVRQGTMQVEKHVSATFASQGSSLFPLMVKGRVENLEDFNNRFIKPSFSTLSPSLDALKVKGSLDWDSTLSPAGMEGRVHLKLFSLEMGEGFSLAEAEADVPVSLSLKRGQDAGAEQRGVISIGRLRTERIQLQDQEIRLTFKEGKYHISRLDLPLDGGIVALSGLVIGNPFSASPHLSMGVSLSDIPIGPLDLLPPPYKLEGTINSREFAVRGTFQHLESDGRIIVDMLGGKTEVYRLAADDVLSPYRKFSCDMEFSSLDMEGLTSALSFGRITGKVSGSLHGLTIANGQPESFSFRMTSVKTKGVPQRVSFNAVSDIQTISSGASVGISLPLGLERFINDLGYDQIGISCVLRNDVFRINGLIHKGGKEYFVSRSGVTGIDVVNMNPENQISFKDMVDRVKRVAEKRAMEVK